MEFINMGSKTRNWSENRTTRTNSLWKITNHVKIWLTTMHWS